MGGVKYVVVEKLAQHTFRDGVMWWAYLTKILCKKNPEIKLAMERSKIEYKYP